MLYANNSFLGFVNNSFFSEIDLWSQRTVIIITGEYNQKLNSQDDF